MTSNQKTLSLMALVSVVSYLVGGLKLSMLCAALMALYWGMQDE